MTLQYFNLAANYMSINCYLILCHHLICSITIYFFFFFINCFLCLFLAQFSIYHMTYLYYSPCYLLFICSLCFVFVWCVFIFVGIRSVVSVCQTHSWSFVVVCLYVCVATAGLLWLVWSMWLCCENWGCVTTVGVCDIKNLSKL